MLLSQGQQFADIRYETQGPGQFSDPERALIDRAVGRLEQINFPQEFGGRPLDTPVRLFRNIELPELAYTRRSGSELVIDLHPDALRSLGRLTSTLGHEFVHAYDLDFGIFHNNVLSEAAAYRWEIRNAPLTGLGGRDLERVQILYERYR